MTAARQPLVLTLLSLAAAASLAACGSDSNDPAPPAVPTLTGILPNAGTISGGTAVTIAGTGLTGATVTFGGLAGTVTASSDTSISATTPSRAAGSVDVVVTTAGGQATLAGVYAFEVPVVAACQAYCATMTTTCTGGALQYATEAACNASCNRARTGPALWSEGTAGTAANSLACRVTHVGLAASSGNTAVHCPHAGASGGNLCGNWCENYCDAALAACTGARALHADKATCLTACAALPATGVPNATSGNTVQCRIYHLGVAASSEANAAVHCAHGSITPTGPCS